MKIIDLYRYPHPLVLGKWLYVGQGIKRDKVHRTGKSSFGRRFKVLFPDIPLPEPVRWTESAVNCLEKNEAETMAMFRYHTWHGYPGGMNLTLPGSTDYENLGHIGGLTNAKKPGYLARIAPLGGKKNVENGHAGRIGNIQGRKNVESGLLLRICKAGGRIGGKISGRMNVENGQLATLRTFEHQSKAGRQGGIKTASLGIGVHAPGMAAKGGKVAGPANGRKLGYSGMGNCFRWNINRGKSCTCGKHTNP